jgi:hypothetical protein
VEGRIEAGVVLVVLRRGHGWTFPFRSSYKCQEPGMGMIHGGRIEALVEIALEDG